MPIEIIMPRLSDTMEEGTLIKWRVSVGDTVAAGDHLADVETDKATMELQAFDDGTVAQIAVEEGQTVPVGSVIMLLAGDEESAQDIAQEAAAPAQKPDEQPEQPEQPQPEDLVGAGVEAAEPTLPTTTSAQARHVRISPVAQKLASEHGLDLGQITGSGPDGRIIKRDVLAALEPGTRGVTSAASPTEPPTPTPMPTKTATGDQTIAISPRRKTIAARLVESKTTIPHFQVSVTIAMDSLLELRRTLNDQLQDQQIKLSVNDFIVRAAALACAKHPQVNSRWDQTQIIQYASVHLGVAVSLTDEQGGGLVVPVIRNCQTKSLTQISQEVKALANTARTTGLSIEQMTGGTFTITNLGMYQVDSFTAIINPPEAAILAVGSATQKPVVRAGQLTLGHEMTATLSADHRVLDGAIAAQFLATVKNYLENPATLLI